MYKEDIIVIIKVSVFVLLFFSLFSCNEVELIQQKRFGVAQIVYTSDLHYGAPRTFRGTAVEANVVNKELVRQINIVPEMVFPDDGGINACKLVEGIDYLIITGDIVNIQQIGPPVVQSASKSWEQFESDFLNGITLTNQNFRKTNFFLECGNHDVSNCIGSPKPLDPLFDASSIVNIYNYMISPPILKTNTTYNFKTDKINYSRDIVGVHLVFITMWPDSANRIWMEKDLATVSDTTPVIIFTHDQPDCEAKHFTNPNGIHDINPIDKFENLVEERFKDTTSINAVSTIEQRGFVSFLKSHENIKAYFHGNDNRNEFYDYNGPDKDINLKIFRVDSPIKGVISGTDAVDGVGDESKLSFQTISIDGDKKIMTVRECLWNTSGTASPLVWGSSSTISLK